MTCRAALCALLLLAACSPNDYKAPTPKIIEDQHGALDKAKTVDSMGRQQGEEQRKEIEQQTQ
jgi:uncharacterized membrane protein YgcG